MALLGHLVILSVLFCAWLDVSEGHGRLIEPAARNAMWRYKYQNPRNYNDMGLNCGGFPNQFEKNHGKCGVCGDPWQGPRRHEAGGKYARGVIARQYRMGSLINVTVTLTSNHMGYFEFRLCPVNNPRKRATQACMDKNQLNIIGHGSRYFIRDRQSRIDIEMLVMLPPRMKCTQCVLQWKYVAGQSMGPDGFGGECLGCGNQEHFINCADIAIGNHAVTPLPTTQPPAGPTKSTFVAAPQINSGNVYGHNGANSIIGKTVQTQPWLANPNPAYNQMTNSWQNTNKAKPAISQMMPSYFRESFDWITEAPPTSYNDYGQSQTQNYDSLTEQQQEQLNEYNEAREAGETPKTAPPQHDMNNQWRQNSIPQHNSLPTSSHTNNQNPSYITGYNDAIRALKTKLGITGLEAISDSIRESQKKPGNTGGCPQPVCTGINAAAGNREFDAWCTQSCKIPSQCPANMCACNCPSIAHGKVCRGVDRSKGAAMDSWCQINCKGNHCPPNLCICS